MTESELLSQIARGEDSSREFKADVKNPASLASELVAFANSKGGTIYIGVADDGSVPGLSSDDVFRINQMIEGAASQLVRSPLTVQTENVPLENGHLVIALSVPGGINKPYFDKDGVIWLKTGADKRRINSREELFRMIQFDGRFHADKQPTQAGIDRLDKLRFRDFLANDAREHKYPDSPADLVRLLKNMNLAADNGKLNLAGVLFFTERPEWIVPECTVKAMRYPGNDIHATDYIDTQDFSGPLPQVFDNALDFIMRNMHKVQAGRGVNAPGTPEIPKEVFEELLVNALVHRDYLVSAAIRIFVFDNRVEIISPGHLPNNLTVEKIRSGISNIRNPTLASYAAKGLLPYYGLGSGIRRALERWPHIEFIDDHEGCLFTAVIHRKSIEEINQAAAEQVRERGVSWNAAGEKDVRDDNGDGPGAGGGVPEAGGEAPDLHGGEPGEAGAKPGVRRVKIGKTAGKILAACRERSDITVPELAERLGASGRTVQRHIRKLQQDGLLKRVGGRKQGHWVVPDGPGGAESR